MQLHKCLICKQHQNQIKDYRDDFDIEPLLIAAHPEIRNLGFMDPLHVCQQCIQQVIQPDVRQFRVPQSQPERTPDTTFSSQENQRMTDSSPKESTESMTGKTVAVIPENQEEIDKLFPHEPLKRYKLGKIIKESLPAGERKRKFEEIIRSKEGLNIPKSVQERMVIDFVSKDLKQRMIRRIGPGNKRPRVDDSNERSDDSARQASSQNEDQALPNDAKRTAPLTESLSSVDSFNSSSSISVAQENRKTVPASKPPPTTAAKPAPKKTGRPKSRQLPERQPTPDLPDQQVPSRSMRSSSRQPNEGTAHSNMGAPLRPTIPYITPTSLTTRASKDIHGA